MGSFIENVWKRPPGGDYERADILDHRSSPEGLDVYRVKSGSTARIVLAPDAGHIVTVLRGEARLSLDGVPTTLRAHTHGFLPRGLSLELSDDFSGVFVSAPDVSRVSGDVPLIRDERVLFACMEERPLRWILTPQYLSRRVFLHHDRTLVSRAGDPISWFRTTMFDVRGLPENEEGLPVFRMSYNHRTEPNVCYDVQGNARVRMARHPYSADQQAWDPWQPLDSETTYYLDEAQDGPELEWVDQAPFRNKHEVYVSGGHVSLLCLFDPAPTGAEQHHAGAYSDYGPLSSVLGTPEHGAWLEAQGRWDPFLNELSLAFAQNAEQVPPPPWNERWQSGKNAQLSYQRQLLESIAKVDAARGDTFSQWMGDRGLS